MKKIGAAIFENFFKSPKILFRYFRIQHFILGTTTRTPKDPWAREEQERQAEARREAARIWQEQQIKELLSLPQRNPQQEEQLRVLQLEREFQRRALEADQDDEDTEKV